MKNRLLRLSCALVGLVLLTSLLAPAAFAANATSAVSPSASSVTVGATFTVTMKVSGSSIGSIQGTLNYDANVIEFVSGDGCNGGGGTVLFSRWSDSGAAVTALSATATFTAKAAGSSSLSLTLNEVCDGNYMDVSCAGSSSVVTVVGTASLSDNANLSSLKLSAGALSPAFSANTTSYTATVDNSVTKVTVSAVAADKNAKTSISGSDAVSVGTNTRTITVTAQNGSTKKYTVRITRKAADGTVSATEPVSEAPVPVGSAVTVSVDGKTMTVLEDLSETEVPVGFSPAELKLNDTSVLCVKNKAGIALLYLVGEENSGFYLYDNESISFLPYTTVTIGNVAYIPLIRPRNAALPVGFSPTELVIGETTLTAWQAVRNDDFYLLYLSGPAYAGFYLYDASEGTVQRYVTLGTKEAEADVEDSDEPTGLLAFVVYNFTLVCILIGLLFAGLVTALVLVIVLRKHRETPKKAEAEPEEPFDDDTDGMIFDFDHTEDVEDAEDADEKED